MTPVLSLLGGCCVCQLSRTGVVGILMEALSFFCLFLHLFIPTSVCLSVCSCSVQFSSEVESQWVSVKQDAIHGKLALRAFVLKIIQRDYPGDCCHVASSLAVS